MITALDVCCAISQGVADWCTWSCTRNAN